MRSATSVTGGAMDARRYLKQYEDAVDRIRYCQEEYDEEMLLVDAIRSPSDNDGMPHGTGISKPTEQKAERLALKALRLFDAKLEAIRIRQEVFDTIMQIGGLESKVLIERFVYLKTWDEVCRSVHYSWPTVRGAWHHGEEKLEDIINTRTSKGLHVL